MRTASRCATCGGEIALWAAKPRITADGQVALECTPCALGERSLIAAAIERSPEPAPVRRGRGAWLGAATGAAALFGIAMLGASSTQRPRAAAAAVPEEGRPRPVVFGEVLEPDDDPGDTRTLVTVEPEPNLPETPELPPMPERGGEPYDEWFPTLRGWVHPVPGSPDIVPRKGSRVFGADRTSHTRYRPECGGGHCGVDLEGDRGQPVVAVAWGTVVRVQTDPDRIGGRYVRIEHPDFVYSSYFHLDRIAPDLRVGDEVEPGTPIGALGKSGIEISMAHLHFSLELPDERRQIRFVDPVPYLARAEVLPRDAVPDFPDSEAPAEP